MLTVQQQALILEAANALWALEEGKPTTRRPKFINQDLFAMLDQNAKDQSSIEIIIPKVDWQALQAGRGEQITVIKNSMLHHVAGDFPEQHTTRVVITKVESPPT